MKNQIIEIERSYEKSTQDDFLFAPELKGIRYLFGYASFFRRGNVHHTLEYRLTEKCDGCPKFIKGCRGKWWGFAYQNTAKVRQGPWALYKCKHGIGHVGLVSEIRQ